MGPRHDELHQRYILELREAIGEVRVWWDELVNTCVDATGSRVAAAAELEKRWPAGPSAHPRIIAVIHKYYLACEALNTRLRKEQRDDPEAEEPHAFESKSVGTSRREPDGPVPPSVFVGESL